jgi:hypothetical protein
MRVLVCAGVSALVLVVNAASALAQDIGIKAGLTSATLSVTGLQGFDPDAAIGVLVGGWLSMGRETVRLQPEVVFTTRRFSAPSPGGDIEVSSRVLDVPVLLMTRWRPGGRVHPLLFGGPYFAFIFDPTQTVGGVETDLSSQIESTDWGMGAGGGVEIDAAGGALVLETRFTWGLRDLSAASETTFKSRTAMASFGYRF